MAPAHPTSRPRPHAPLIVSIFVAGAGYLLPWFQIGDRQWLYSGWRYLEEGGGWTLCVPILLIATLVCAVWAGGSTEAAALALATSVAALAMAVLVIASALMDGGTTDIDDIALSIGIPIMVAGLGLAVTSCVVSIATNAADSAVDALRRRLSI